MKARSVKYKTTITGIQEVFLSGEIVYDPDKECYTIGGDSADHWFERINDKQPDSYLTVRINVHDGNPDDSELVEQGQK